MYREKDLLETKRGLQDALSELDKKSQSLKVLGSELEVAKLDLKDRETKWQKEMLALKSELSTLKDLLASRESELASKDDSLRQRQTELDKLKGLINEANRDMQNLRSLVAQKDGQIDVNTKEILTLTDQRDWANEQNRTMASEIEKLKESAKINAATLDELNYGMSDLGQQLAHIKEVLRQRDVEVDRLVGTNTEFKQEVDRLNLALNEAKIEADGLKRRIADFGFEGKMKDGDLERMKNQLDERQDEIYRLTSLFGECKGNLSSLQERLKSSEQENDRISSELKKKSTELANAKDAQKKGESSNSELTNEISNLKNSIEDLKNDLGLSMSKIAGLEQKTVPELKSQLLQLTKEKTLKANEVEDMLKKLEASSADLAKSKAQAAKLEQAIASVNQDLKEKTEKIGG